MAVPGLMATLKDALATLATVPPKAFARQRDALAAQFRDAGDTTTAAQLKARRVPTLPVWVVNRLALEHHDDVEAFIAATARVKAAQLGRGPGGGVLATATAGHRAALDRLRERAGIILREAGGVTADKLLRVQNTLTAAAVDAKARTALQAGQLEGELTAPGFDVFGGARPPATRRAGRVVAPHGKTAVPPARTAAAAPAVSKAAQRRREREVERAQRQERVAQARTAVTEAEQKAASAHQDVTAAKRRLRELLEQAQEARRDLRERTAAARQQDAAVTRAQRGLRTAARKAGS